MTLERVDEMTSPPVVGRYYLVPCVQGDVGRRTPRWVALPVMGPPHEDLDVFPRIRRHYHFDVRFVRLGHIAQGKWDGVNRAFFRVQEVWDSDAITYRELRCLRHMPEHPGFLPQTTACLEALVQGQTLRGPCKVCPHRGIPLASLPASPEGTVTCPGHGLTWDVETGRLVRRVPR